MLQIFTSAVANLANASERFMDGRTALRVLTNIFSMTLVCQHPPSEFLVSKIRFSSLCPGAEERAVVAEQGQGKV